MSGDFAKTKKVRYRRIDAWGVEAIKVAPYIASHTQNGRVRKWLLTPVHSFIPGHKWEDDDAYLRLTRKMTGEEIEFAKAWVLSPENRTAAVRMIYPKRLMKREEPRRASILSKRESVVDLRDYLRGLYLEERRATDRLRVTPEQILCELETVWLESTRSPKRGDKDRVERLGKFLWAVRTGVWGASRYRAPIDKDEGTVAEAASNLKKDSNYSEAELTSFLDSFLHDQRPTKGNYSNKEVQ